MDKAVIFGTFEFVGFHFCMSLLEKGMEVVGINDSQQENEDYMIDKRLTIGRNANFSEVEMEQWLPLANIVEQTVVIIDYYDFYIRKQAGFFNKHSLVEDFFRRNLQVIKETNSSIIMLLPVQWLSPTEQGNFKFLQGFPCYRIYLPTIYGPWQSNIFLYQQALLKKLHKVEKLCLNEREWTHDAIYIDDVVNTSLNLIDNPVASYLLKSETEDQWLKCAQFLAIPLKEISFQEKNSVIETKDITMKIVKSSQFISKGMEEQKKHIIFLSKG